MIRRLVLPLAALALATPAQAAWMAPNGMTVDGSAEDIIVNNLPGHGSSEYFCAAADYAVARLGAAPNHAVVVTRPRSGAIDGHGGEDVGFRLDAAAEANHGFFLRVSKPGVAVKIGHARQMCGTRHD